VVSVSYPVTYTDFVCPGHSVFCVNGRTGNESASCDVLRAVNVLIEAVCCMTQCNLVGTGV
jgi:hypothetical protein